MLLCSGPEELVRQRIVDHLIEELGVPESLISTEYHLGRISPRIRERADIVVWAVKDEHVMLVIEVKAEDFTTGAPLEQVMRYQKTLKSTYVGVACNHDCSLLQIYKVVNGKPMPLKAQPSFSEMSSGYGLISHDELPDMLRLPYLALLRDDYLEDLKESIEVLGTDTPDKLAPFVSCLHNFILSAPIELKLPYEIGGISIIKDLGISERSYGNAGGGAWGLEYRGFHIRDFDGNDQFCWFSVAAAATKETNAKVGYSRSTSNLIVAVDDYESSHNSLQLSIDKNVEYNEEEDVYEIWHDGRMTMGNSGPVKKQVVLDFIQEISPNLVHNGRVYLGTTDGSRAMGGKSGWELVSRLILYALLRDRLRGALKKNKLSQNSIINKNKNVRSIDQIRHTRDNDGINIDHTTAFFEQPFSQFYTFIAGNMGLLKNHTKHFNLPKSGFAKSSFKN